MPARTVDQQDLGGYVSERDEATLSEVADAFGISEATARRQLDGLVGQRLLGVEPGTRGPRARPRRYFVPGTWADPVRSAVMAALVLVVLLAAGCGGGGSSKPEPAVTTTPKGETVMTQPPSNEPKIWCLYSDEKLTPQFKREYSERYMTKAECHLWLTGEIDPALTGG